MTYSALSLPLLVATDGSPSARVAQQLAMAFAGAIAPPIAESSSLVVLSVQPKQANRRLRFSLARNGGATKTAIAEQPVDSPQSGSELLQELATALPTDLSIDYQVRQGRPTTEILNYARSIKAGMIAVGSGKDKNGVRDLLLGDVSSVVARYAPCSVLVGRSTPDRPLTSLKKVVLLIDGGATKRAIGLLQQLLPVGIEQVILLCVQHPVNAGYLFGPFTAPNPSWQLNQSLQAAQKDQADHQLSHAKAALNAHAPNLLVETHVEMGDAGLVLCKVAEHEQVDLILLASEGLRQPLLKPLQDLRHTQNQHPLRNTRLNATEDYAIHHAPCSVLLYRPTI